MPAGTLRFGAFPSAQPLPQIGEFQMFRGAGTTAVLPSPEGGKELMFFSPTPSVTNGNDYRTLWLPGRMPAGADYVDILARFRKPESAHATYRTTLVLLAHAYEGNGGFNFGQISFAGDTAGVSGGRVQSGSAGWNQFSPAIVNIPDFAPGEAYWFARWQCKVQEFSRVRAWRDGDPEPDSWGWIVAAGDVSKLNSYGRGVGFAWQTNEGAADTDSRRVMLESIGYSFDPNEAATTDPSGRILVRSRQLR